MADVKISALPASTTPLTGAEVLPIVQSGVTKQVSVANLTAGRATQSSTHQVTTTVGVGAATPAASGVGVTFPSTQSLSTDVNTLDDYREGTFTATGTGFSDATPPSGTARYVKVGNMVMIYLPEINGTSNATTFTVTGLPTELYPSANRRTSVVARDNGGAFVMCRAIVGSSGVITLSSNVDGAAWTASGSKILSAFMTFYII